MTGGVLPQEQIPLFNPFAEGFTDNPYPQYATLRETAPVYPHPMGFWVVTRYEDVFGLLRSGASVELRNVDSSGLESLRQKDESRKTPLIDGFSMIDRDAPDHTRLRRLVQKAFTPKSIQALAPRIGELVDGMLDRIAEDGGADLVPALASPLPFTVIADMLGAPPTDHERIRELSGTIVRSLEPVADPALMQEIENADAELAALTAEMIAWKRRNPADDLMTALIEAEEDGDKLSDDELVAQIELLYIAGHETTVNLLANGTLALLRHPEQLGALRADAGLMPNAVDELLRYDSPLQSSRRITLEPTVLSGVEIPPGSMVVAALASANRDAARWGEDADTLRLDREGARAHLAFGSGSHHCLGAALARLEASITFERMLKRFPDLALAGDVTWNGRINVRGVASLPVSAG
ncbi:cytochrome P450 [Streptomyces capillispiralis]|uniref:Cytochrome P450 n=1 Tax=Streptomyces capillispiralis TaxID=68182 RepID=A0A561TQG8_9ACTN|nr:cytochrome P450 [Streptomyces capillispiralis]TWF89354.1 cytochrome P450 [Streptomyces capillispiralis]GHH93674.1 cytochrome P450 [Streptomyces capillispiralis]